MSPRSGTAGRGSRVSLDVLKRKFWVLPGLALLLGGALGYAVPEIDGAFDGTVGLFPAPDVDSARSLLETIATVTISVAGISISVIAVAFTLAAQQLSPRFLRTFRGDRLSQSTLALFVGTFAYSIMVLATIGSSAEALNLSLTVGVAAAAAAFALFAAFIHNALISLDPSTLIKRIAADAHELIDHPYPGDIGSEPDDEQAADREIDRRTANGRRAEVRAPAAGYLTGVSGAELIRAAQEADGIVVQRMPVGDFVVGGAVLADAYADDDPERLAEQVVGCFQLGEQRTLDQDVAFPIRQLADVALRGLSPSLNDPTTSENALGSLADSLVRFVGQRQLGAVRADGEGRPRFRALRPDLDDLVRLGFDQVRVKASSYPVVMTRIAQLLDEVERAAADAGVRCSEPGRQRALLAEAVEGNAPTKADVDAVVAAGQAGERP